MQHRTYAYRIPWTKWSGLVIVASGEVLACFRLRGGLSGKLRLDSSAKHCALLSVFGSRSIVFVLLSPGRIPSELLVVSAAGGLSVRGVQKSSVTCHEEHLRVQQKSQTETERATTKCDNPLVVSINIVLECRKGLQRVWTTQSPYAAYRAGKAASLCRPLARSTTF